MIKINLLPVAASRKKEKIVNQLILAILVILATMGGLGFRYYVIEMEIDKTQAEVDKLEIEIEGMKHVQKSIDEQKQKSNLLDTQRSAIESLGSKSNRNWFIRVLDKIGESAPRKKIFIQDLTFKGKNINIKGWAQEKDYVSKFMGELSIIPCGDLNAEEVPDICEVQMEKCERGSRTLVWEEGEQVVKFVKDYDKCRELYKEKIDEQTRVCGSDLQDAQQAKSSRCLGEKKGTADCKEAKDALEEVDKKCKKVKGENVALHQNEYVKYDSVILKELTRAQLSSGNITAYKFELNMTEK